jgi:hypothetical protein
VQYGGAPPVQGAGNVLTWIEASKRLVDHVNGDYVHSVNDTPARVPRRYLTRELLAVHNYDKITVLGTT